MKKTIQFLAIAFTASQLFAQSEIKEFYDKNGPEKITEKIAIDGKPITARSYDDGHGRNPYLTSTSQIPDTVALITFYVYDKGTDVSGGNYIYTYSLSQKGGNYFANKIYNQSIEMIKKSFKDVGITVLTPEEFLNTEEKLEIYKNFKPNLSKLGSFLTGLESRGTDIAVAADNFRGFDLYACNDHERMESLGYDFAKGLGVDGVLSIATEVVSDKKQVTVTGFKVALNGPNPIPKQDKRYVSQNFGAGYYKGQLYTYGTFFLKSPATVAQYKKGIIQEENYDGIGEILSCFPKRFDSEMRKAIEKNSK